MRHKSFILPFIFAGLCLFNISTAQTSSEAILSFHASIRVNSDNSVDVSETIKYDSGTFSRHGIYRDIYPYSSEDRKMSIENIDVVDENGEPYRFETSYDGDNFRIKIGDPVETFVGQKTYVIKYRATYAVAQLENLDETYWNATGNAWEIPIYEARAEVRLPSGFKFVQSACYLGYEGSKETCERVAGDGVYTFETGRMLEPREGLTIAVGFEKGAVMPYAGSEGTPTFWQKYWTWILGALLPGLTFIFSFWYWYKRGRDPKGRGVIVPQYDVPDNLTPLEAGGIMNEKIEAKYISAEIIYLATQGYLKIRESEEKILGLIKRKDYELIKAKDFSGLTDDFDQKLVNSLFDHGETTVKLSNLKNSFYKSAAKVKTLAAEALLKKGYYKNLGRMKSQAAPFVAIAVFVGVWVSGFIGSLVSHAGRGATPLPLVSGIMLSIVIYGFIYYFSPAKTERGVATKEHLSGLKDYLQIAEKDRILFHNAPEKKPEVFERLLPYAMVMGVAKIWAKEFENIYMTPPQWYSGQAGAFSAIAFSDSIDRFSNFAVSSLASSPHGGSGGGGFSGGGGGGGGGGGW